MLKSSALLLVGWLLPLSAGASNWDSIYLTNAISIEVDRSRPIGKGNIRRAWLRWSYTNPRKDVYGNSYGSTIDLVYVNCAAKATVTVQTTLYTEAFGKGDTIRIDGAARAPAPNHYNETTPGTIGEMVAEQLCK